MPADVTGELDNRCFLLSDAGKGFLIADGIDHRGIEADRDGFHLVKRPFVGLVVLSRRRENRELAECTAHLVFPADIDTRSLMPDCGNPVGRTKPGLRR